MSDFVIANPPSGIYKGDLPVGYAYFNVLLDIYARFVHATKGQDVVCHKYSLNVFGKRASNLDIQRTLLEFVDKWIVENRLRDKMHFSFSGEIHDVMSESVDRTQEVFIDLEEGGNLLHIGDTSFLNVAKIKAENDLEEIVSSINFYPCRIKKEFLRLIAAADDEVRVTKPRKYAVENPLGGEPISPIFAVANLWEGHVDSPIDLMATSEKELTRYVLLRFYSQIGIGNVTPMRNLFVYNYVMPEGGSWKFDISSDETMDVEVDIIRYVFAKGLSMTKQVVQLNDDVFVAGRKLMHLVGNLRKYFSTQSILFDDDISFDQKYLSLMESFRFSAVLSRLESDFRSISRGIIQYRNSQDSQELQRLYSEYVLKVRELTPFCPYVSHLALDNLSLSRDFHKVNTHI